MSTETTISGKIHAILPTETFASGFQKRVFVIDTGGDYPQHIPVEVHKQRCDSLDRHQPGQDITAKVNIRGNEHRGKYYVNLVCWKWEAEEVQQQPAQQTSQPLQGGGTDDDDDIPF